MRQLLFLLMAFSINGKAAAIASGNAALDSANGKAAAIESSECGSRFGKIQGAPLAKAKSKESLKGECSECGYSQINREATK